MAQWVSLLKDLLSPPYTATFLLFFFFHLWQAQHSSSSKNQRWAKTLGWLSSLSSTRNQVLLSYLFSYAAYSRFLSPLPSLWIFFFTQVVCLTSNDHVHLGLLAAYSKITDARKTNGGEHSKDLDFQRIRKHSTDFLFSFLRWRHLNM